MAAFYRLPRCLFYIVGGFHCGKFTIVFVRLPVRSEVKKIVHRMSEILFAADYYVQKVDMCSGCPKLQIVNAGALLDSA